MRMASLASVKKKARDGDYTAMFQLIGYGLARNMETWFGKGTTLFVIVLSLYLDGLRYMGSESVCTTRERTLFRIFEAFIIFWL